MQKIIRENPSEVNFFIYSNRKQNPDGSLSDHIDTDGQTLYGEAKATVYNSTLKWLTSEEAQIIPQLLPFPVVTQLWNKIAPVETEKPTIGTTTDPQTSMQGLFKLVRESMEGATDEPASPKQAPAKKAPLKTKKKKKRIIIIVHGIFNSSNKAMEDAALLAHAARLLDAVIINYDWATHGVFPPNYNGDCQNRRFTVMQLSELIFQLSQKFPDCSLDIVSHSQGCDLTMEALGKLELLQWRAGIRTTEKPLAKKPVRTVTLIAADIWTPVLVHSQFESAIANAEQLYIVGSKIDRILKLGNWVDMGWVDRAEQFLPNTLKEKRNIQIDSYDRIGLMKDFPILPGATGVDATVLDDKLVGHLFAIMLAVQIIYATMEGKTLDQFRGFKKTPGRPKESPLIVAQDEIKGRMSRLTDIAHSRTALVDRVPAKSSKSEKQR
jgi:hypothetical protein